MDIPRVSVCEGHKAPFDVLADMYFERVLSAVAIANRGGSKTFIAAILHLLNSKFKKNCHSASVAAVESQAMRCYAHFQHLAKVEGRVDVADQNPDIAGMTQSKARYHNGSDLEVLVGTMNGVNSWHGQKLVTDEAELMDPRIFDESRNMSQSSEGIKAQDLIISTRKRAHGPMQKLVEEIQDAERQGIEPPYRLYTWCIFEAAQNVPECGTTCGCEKIVKGKWDSGKPRTFRDVCKGRLKRSAGWIPIHDIHKVFRTVSRGVWEAQQECIRPSTEGLVLPMFDVHNRHGIRWWKPEIAYGPIVQGIDFGGTNPHAVNWYQIVKVPGLKAWGTNQAKSDAPEVEIPVGARICFDEIYIADIGNIRLAEMIVERENWWKRYVKGFRTAARFADPASKAARLDFAKYNPPLPCAWYATREIPEHIKIVVELVEEERFFVDTDRCPMFIEEAESWHYPDKKGLDNPEIPVDEFNHCMSNFRYVMANLAIIEKRIGKGKASTPGAGTRVHTTSSIPKAGPPTRGSIPKGEEWRHRLTGRGQ